MRSESQSHTFFHHHDEFGKVKTALDKPPPPQKLPFVEAPPVFKVKQEEELFSPTPQSEAG